METLAVLFVSLVTAFNFVAPKANLPQVLGVQIAENTAVGQASPSTVNIDEDGKDQAGQNSAADDSDEPVSSGSTQRTKTGVRVEARNLGLEKARAEREKIKEELKNKRETAVAEAKAKREEQKAKRAEIKDSRKIKVIEKIDERLVAKIEKHTNRWNEVLARLSEILAKLQSRADKLAGEGIDVAAVKSAISAANLAISSAQAAVSTQAGKSYTVGVTEEGNLRKDVDATIKQFQSDMEGTRNAVKAARDAVKEVFLAIKQLKLPVESENGGGFNE